MASRTDLVDRLDEKSEVFKEGLDAIEQKLAHRHYVSVAEFSAEIGIVFSSALAKIDGPQSNDNSGDMMQIHTQLHEVPAGAAGHLALTQEQKELKRLAKRIVKAVKEPLEDALRKEASLKGLPFAKEQSEWAAFDARLEHSVESRRGSAVAQTIKSAAMAMNTSGSAVGGASPSPRNHSIATVEGEVEIRKVSNAQSSRRKRSEDTNSNSEALVRNAHTTSGAATSKSSAKNGRFHPAQPLSPPISTSSVAQTIEKSSGERGVQQGDSGPDSWSRGGVPWYWSSFDVIGTTVHDERWTGQETMRAMSEVLSEMNDEDLRVLEQSTGTANDDKEGDTGPAPALRRSLRGGANAEVDEVDEVTKVDAVEEMDEETEAQKVARAKKDAYNLKRRLQRAANKKK